MRASLLAVHAKTYMQIIILWRAQVSALFHIASSTDPPPIPPRLSKEGRDFLLRCFNRQAFSHQTFQFHKIWS